MIKFLEKNQSIALIFLALIALEIFLVSTIPGNQTGTGGPDLSQAYHFIVFFLLNFFLLVTLTGRNKLKMKYILIAVVVSVVYAFLDEIHQMFVPFRAADIGDILIDSLGILVSSVTYYYSKTDEQEIL